MNGPRVVQMVFKRPLAIVCLSIACGKGHDFSFYDAGTTSPSSQPPPTLSNCDSTPFTIDGLFTGFVPSTSNASLDTSEWGGIAPVRGKYTYMYMTACSTGSANRLYFINDWYTNDKAAIAGKCFNRFDFFDPASEQAIELRVYGDHHVDVFDHGVRTSWAAKGHAGFASSPNVGAPHSLFEFQLDLPWSQDFIMAASDPCNPQPPSPPPPTQPNVGTECDDPTYMIDEPTTVAMHFDTNGVATSIAPDVPRATGLDKYDAAPGDRVVLRGRRFGAAAGHVLVGGIEAQVLLWTDSRVQFVVPNGVGGNAQTTITGEGYSVSGPRITGPASPAN
jgi:hypothetical protein